MYNSDYLAHYGVLGMKWGIRRYQPYPKGQKNKGKYIGEEGFKKALIDRENEVESITIPKNTKVSRLSTRRVENVKNVRKYVSVSDNVEDRWKKLYEKRRAMGENIFEHSFNTVKDLKVSTGSNNVKEFYNWLNKDPDVMFQKIEMVTDANRSFLRVTGMDQGKSLDDDFFKSIGWESKASDEYMNHMKQKGYDAIADIFGINSGGEKSIIVLDPDKTLKLRNVKEV